MSDKPGPNHLQRKAMLYVRQSTQRQIVHNKESRKLQYAVETRLRDLGWCEIEVVDDDLGRSAGGAVKRPGFQRLVAEVGLGKVGGVAARELSRLARNSRDWQQLVEVCRYVDTLLIDEETIYDPRNSNDRLLLGVKGSLNEYELDLLRLRGLEAKRAKARRGEYYARVPVGYTKGDGGLVKHPDRRIQQMVALIFDKLVELGSVRQLLCWLKEQGLDVPRAYGDRVVWKAPGYHHLICMIKNPAYAGFYVYGRTVSTRILEEGQLRQRTVHTSPEQWILIPDRHEGYISREQFEQIQEMVSRNRQRHPSQPGAAKKGAALLAGLLRCRRCGHKLTVGYSGQRRDIARYECVRSNTQEGDARCISFSSVDVDPRVVAEVLDAVRPEAIEATLTAAQEQERARSELLETRRVELEAAQYAADRAWRQYDAADPANRLVVDELEHRWNQALERVGEVEAQLQREQECRVEPPPPEVFARLASDLQVVWDDPKVDASLKKRIIRTVIEEIFVDVDDAAREIVLVIHWKGGVHTELRVVKRRIGQNRVRTPDSIVEAVRKMALVCNDARIAMWLSRAGIRTARGNRWTRALVASLRSQHKIPCYDEERRRDEGWVTKREAAGLLGVAEATLQRAVERGEIEVIRPLPKGLWIFNAADLRRPEVLERLQKRRARRDNGAGVLPRKQLSLDISTT
jgi:DNA invertase Pin-like site-specific DNA recombinase